jgi:hypothetical protein
MEIYVFLAFAAAFYLIPLVALGVAAYHIAAAIRSLKAPRFHAIRRSWFFLRADGLSDKTRFHRRRFAWYTLPFVVLIAVLVLKVIILGPCDPFDAPNGECSDRYSPPSSGKR